MQANKVCNLTVVTVVGIASAVIVVAVVAEEFCVTMPSPLGHVLAARGPSWGGPRESAVPVLAVFFAAFALRGLESKRAAHEAAREWWKGLYVTNTRHTAKRTKQQNNTTKQLSVTWENGARDKAIKTTCCRCYGHFSSPQGPFCNTAKSGKATPTVQVIGLQKSHWSSPQFRALFALGVLCPTGRREFEVLKKLMSAHPFGRVP